MQWFYGLKMRAKLLAGFVLVSLITGVVGFIGIKELTAVSVGSTKLYEKIAVPMGDLGDMATAFQQVRINLLEMVDTEDPQEKARVHETINKLRAEMTERGAAFEKTILTEEGRQMYEEFKKSREVYGELIDRLLPLIEADKDDEALALLAGEGKKAAMQEQGMLDKLEEAKIRQGELTEAENEATAHEASRIMGIMIGVGVLLAIGFGLFITSVVQGQLGGDPSEVGAIATRVAAGDMSMTIDLHGKKGD